MHIMERRTASPPAVLTVEVLNINDNHPMFEQETLTVQLQEESEEGLSLFLSACIHLRVPFPQGQLWPLSLSPTRMEMISLIALSISLLEMSWEISHSTPSLSE